MEVPECGDVQKFDRELSKTTKSAVMILRALELIPTGGPRLGDISFNTSNAELNSVCHLMALL
jgi:hypothetical protein